MGHCYIGLNPSRSVHTSRHRWDGVEPAVHLRKHIRTANLTPVYTVSSNGAQIWDNYGQLQVWDQLRSFELHRRRSSLEFTFFTGLRPSPDLPLKLKRLHIYDHSS